MLMTDGVGDDETETYPGVAGTRVSVGVGVGAAIAAGAGVAFAAGADTGIGTTSVENAAGVAAGKMKLTVTTLVTRARVTSSFMKSSVIV
jgi:hypothetical protein